MNKRIIITLMLMISFLIIIPLSAREEGNLKNIYQVKQEIINAVNNWGNELSPSGSSGTGVPASTAGSTDSGCVEIDVELPDTVIWTGEPDSGMAEGFIELTNCGAKAAEIQVIISLSIQISYLVDTTFYVPAIPIPLGAGETVVRKYVFPIPEVEGEITVCATAFSGAAQDADCSSMAIVGLGTNGILMEAYGVLFQGTGCILFAPAGDASHGYVLENYGEFGVGDTVYVTGYLQWGCATECPEAVGCINDNTIERAGAPAMTFESCGVLAAAQDCILFIPTIGNSWPYNPADSLWQMILTLENYGVFQPGDSVYVSGTLIMQSNPTCPQAVGTVVENSIEPCTDWPPTPYSACGVLMQGVECVLFAPLADTGSLLVLDNYGPFGVGDTVMVSGFLVIDCMNICMQGNGCVVNNQIDSCGGPPTDYISGCGILIETSDCMMFQPFDNSPDSQSMLYHIENYDGFGNLDTVFVSGPVLVDCQISCDTPFYGCIMDNIIDTCGSDNPVDSFSACGVITIDSNCILFSPLYSDSLSFKLYDNYGHVDGDTVFVNGWMDWNCYSYSSCIYYGCLNVYNMTFCDTTEPTYPYEACGILLGYPQCLLFAPLDDYYTRILLDNYGGYSAGDTVYVTGQYAPSCQNSCGDSVGCLYNNSIRLCNNNPPDSVSYEGCGLLREDFGCLLFISFMESIPPTVLDNYGSYVAGDTVFAAGMVYFDCGPVCDTPGIGCMKVDTISTCGSEPGTPFQSCGYLYQGPLCLLFRPEYFPDTVIGYKLENYGTFVTGDTVFVDGWLENYLLNDCVGVSHVVANNSIGPCDSLPPDTTYYSGCGMLWDDTGCVRFYPYDGAFPPAVLTDYGSFREGDEVYVSGVLNFDCTHPCAYGPYICLDNDTIITCGGNQGEPYGGCGVLWMADSCLLFHPITPDTMWYYRFAAIGPYELGNYGDYGNGDTVYVNGTLFPNCTSGCPGATGCIFDNTIGECGSQLPDSFYFAGCGVLVDDTGCILFYTGIDSIPRALLTNYGSFTVGDSVYVDGWLNITEGCECYTIIYPCIHNTIIDSCGGFISDTISVCGVLVQGTECIVLEELYPDSGFAYMAYLLDNYDSFGVGDTVRATGLLRPNDSLTFCPEAQMRIAENTIGYCNGKSPTVSRVGDINALQIYPNPFNPAVTISFNLPSATRVSLKIYNILGQEVETLVNNQVLEGDQKYEWDGSRFGSGVYFYRLNTENVKRTGKMILAK